MSRSPSLLCGCGHVYHVHPAGGRCRVVHGCDCDRFVEAPRITGARPGQWLPYHRSPRLDVARERP